MIFLWRLQYDHITRELFFSLNLNDISQSNVLPFTGFEFQAFEVEFSSLLRVYSIVCLSFRDFIKKIEYKSEPNLNDW